MLAQGHMEPKETLTYGATFHQWEDLHFWKNSEDPAITPS